MRVRRWLIILLLLLTAAAILGWTFRRPLVALHIKVRQEISTPGTPAIKPDPKRYDTLCKELKQSRQSLAKRYNKAKTNTERATIEHEARTQLETLLPELMRCWLGTKWDFNGTAAKPGQGKIACGYFVSTVLQDAGFKLNRYQLAQQASSNIIHTFIPETLSTLTVGQDYTTFTHNLITRDPGIYICGLDSHVGFVVKTKDSFRFIHSSGCKPWTVVDEAPSDAIALQASKWRMLGNLTANPQVIQTWLKGDAVTVKQ